MQCFVFRSIRKAETYLILPNKDDIQTLPSALLQVFGEPEFSFEFELTAESTMAQADPSEVIQSLETQGFYLQIPPENDTAI